MAKESETLSNAQQSEIDRLRKELEDQSRQFDRERRRYRDALTNGCEYSYSFDVTEGLIYKPFITAREIDIVEELGLTLPISFDELNSNFIKSFELKFADEEMAHLFTCKGLLEQFALGRTNVTAEYYLPKLDLYTRVSTLMSLEEENDHVHAFVIATDITETKNRESKSRQALQDTRGKLDKSNQELQLLMHSLDLMKDTYYRIGCINLDNNTMQTIVTPADEQCDTLDFLNDYNKAVQKMAVDYVLPEYREKFLSVLRPECIRRLLTKEVNYVDVTYRRLEGGEPHWVRSELIAVPGYGETHHNVMWYVKDISYEKAMEDRMSQQLIKTNADMNMRLEMVLGNISGGFKMSRADEKFSFSYVSPAVAAIQGYTVEEFITATKGSVTNNIYPDDLDEVLQKLRQQLNNSDTYSVKYRVLHKDGSFRWIQDSGKEIVEEDGTVVYYSLIQDVTHQEKQKIALRNAMTMQTQMVNSFSLGIFAYTLPERNILLLNEEAKRIFNCPPQSDFDFMSAVQAGLAPEDTGTIQTVKKTLNSPGDKIKYIFHTHTDSDHVLTIQCTSQLLEFEDGHRFILSSMVDLTDRFHMEALLEEERKQYRDVLIEGSELSFSFDLTDGIVNSSIPSQTIEPGLTKLGLTPPVSYDDMMDAWFRLKGLKPFRDSSNAIINRETLLKQYQKGNVRIEEEYHAGNTDQYYRILILLSQSKNDGHIHAIFIAYNTTRSVKEAIQKENEQRQKDLDAKRALQEAYDAAQRANSAKTDFLANMSHDIRTPMNAIIGLTAIAGTHLDDKDRVADCLSKITVSSKHLLGLINEVLDMSKIESGKIDLQEENFNLPDLIDTLLTMSKPQIDAKRHELTVNINGIEHEQVVGDIQRIQQSFMNLMSNAIKYTPEGGHIRLSVTEKPTNQRSFGCYEFIFEDNGIGMSPEFQSVLFQPFERAKDSRVEKIQGTGLGMAIAKNLVLMMNGDIQVESELNKGTKFIITIYLKLQDTDENVSYEDFIALPVLVADDDEISCKSACQILDDLGMNSRWVLSGREAVRLVTERHEEKDDFFAVILDWKMPDMNGVETTREIRRLVGKEVPIIIISAYDWSDIEQEARMAGVDAFISKPLFKSRMVHLFNDLLGKNSDEKKLSSLDSIVSQDFTGKRALLVEDNEINTEIAGEILKMAGLEMEFAENGKQAVDMINAAEDGYYDIVFMDIQMPVMNGYDATRAIRSLPSSYVKRVPIIAMTANAFADDVAAAKEAGMNEHIAKPLDFDHLNKVLQKWLA